MGNPGNPNFLNDLKNTYNSFSVSKLRSAAKRLYDVLTGDLPQIPQLATGAEMTVCIVPRAKAEGTYHPNQLLFRRTVTRAVNGIKLLSDGTDLLQRHTNTRTTHLRRPIPNYNNDGVTPYPGITADTCKIAQGVVGKHILLVDDIYTPGVNIDEDALDTIMRVGASSVTFYAVAKV